MTPQTARAVVAAAILFAFAGAGFAVYGWLGTAAGPSKDATGSFMS